MGKRLGDNISSAYIEAANRLNSKSARRRVVAYVESYDDVFFWRAILGSLENDKLRFEVMLPTRKNKLERGKKAAISRLLSQVGRDMIACVMPTTTISSRDVPTARKRYCKTLTSSTPMPMPLRICSVMPLRSTMCVWQ